MSSFVDLLFYIFSGFLVISSVMVVGSRDPVYAVLYLIFAFFNAASLFILIGAEFIGMILIIVYVGAVATLFLFTVMMLPQEPASSVSTTLKQRIGFYKPLGLVLALICFVEILSLWMVPSGDTLLPETETVLTNTESIGSVLYTTYFYPFQILGILMLTGIVASIILTLQKPKSPLKTTPAQQFKSTHKNATLITVETGKGIEK